MKKLFLCLLLAAPLSLFSNSVFITSEKVDGNGNGKAHYVVLKDGKKFQYYSNGKPFNDAVALRNAAKDVYGANLDVDVYDTHKDVVQIRFTSRYENGKVKDAHYWSVDALNFSEFDSKFGSKFGKVLNEAIEKSK